MDGIYKVTLGSWSSPSDTETPSLDLRFNGSIDIEVDDDHDMEIDGRKVVAGDKINIPIISPGDPVPPPGTMVYLLGIDGVPNGIYEIIPDVVEEPAIPDDSYDPGINPSPPCNPEYRFEGVLPPVIVDHQVIKGEYQ